ncbi:hypothetical protein KPL70_006843 [Citrus sinensis]|uniref:Cytochrome P450 n=1 Tax=Citrus clementina TaxID=85681 RepID=V4TVW3_CITCL|nr:phenylacetaldehyde oxime monooxygenase CYP71AN24-like [Citrus sinensis]ESR55870.1 hypothetical protein CICLE_v10023290mg [Citrus x clementina]KAH9722793.1 hypothetical protein KPL70_006843 [Citrus sinensis]
MATVSVLMKRLLQPFTGISEIYNPALSTFLLLLILLLTLVQLLKITRRSSNHLNLPPSPPKLPILGNLHQLLGTLPHRSLKALSERYGPLMFVYCGNSPTLVVSSAELACEMFKTHDIVISNRPKTTPANILLYECQGIGIDPQVWDRSEDFLPNRFFSNPVDCKGQDFQFIPFGAGRRGCPGISFALAAVEYVMANLLYWFDWNLPLGEVEENLDMFEVNGLVVHKKLPLHLVPTLCSPYS